MPFQVVIPPALQQELLWWPPRQRGLLFGRLRTLAEALTRRGEVLPRGAGAPPPAPRELVLYAGQRCARVAVQAEEGRVEVQALGQVRLPPPGPGCRPAA